MDRKMTAGRQDGRTDEDFRRTEATERAPYRLSTERNKQQRTAKVWRAGRDRRTRPTDRRPLAGAAYRRRHRQIRREWRPSAFFFSSTVTAHKRGPCTEWVTQSQRLTRGVRPAVGLVPILWRSPKLDLLTCST